MKVKQINSSSAIGTSLQGYLNDKVYTEKILKAHFGAPTKMDELYDKVTKQWVLDIGGTIVTIYDYKGHKWHIGGRGEAAVVLVKAILNAKNKDCHVA